MIAHDTVSAIYRSVCALGIRLVDQEQHKKEPTAPHFNIIGTGFAIDANLVLTNRHVLEAMRQEMKHSGYSHDDLMVQFITPKANGWSLHYCRIGAVGLCTDQEEDVGLIHIPGLAEIGPRAVSFGDPSQLSLGQDLALLGYADGLKLQQANRGEIFYEELYRFGPILQRGYLSAVAPMHGCGIVTRLLLDIRTTGGLSGSPVFIPKTGEVVGIHFASNKLTTAFSIPLDSKRVEVYRDSFQSSVARWVAENSECR